MATLPGPPEDVGRHARRGSGDLPRRADEAAEDCFADAAPTVVDGWPGLRAAAAVGPFFSIDRLDDDPSWRAMSEFADHPEGLPARVTATMKSPLLQALRRPTPSADRLRVAASVAFLGLAARLVSPALGSTLCTGIVPNLSGHRLRWRPAPTGIVPLACGPVDGWVNDPGSGTDPHTIAALSETVITPTLALGATVAVRFGLSGQIVRGNVASAIAGAAAAVARSGRCTEQAAVDLATALLGHSGLTLSGSFSVADRQQPRFRRNSCCLLYRAGGGFCGDCVLASEGLAADTV